MTYTNNNGKISANVTLSSNAAFRYGVGLFETILVREGAIRLAEYHWQRLFEGMDRLGFERPVLFSPDYLAEQVLKTVRRNGWERLCRVRLQVYGADGGLYDREHYRPLYIIECYPLTLEMTRMNENGLIVGIAEGVAKAPNTLSNLKTSNALVYAMAAQQARHHKWNDALVCNVAGHIIESSIANVFWAKDGVVFTPPLSEGCVAGVMRRHLLRAVHVQQTPLTAETLKGADEVFLTNAVRGLRWVGQCGERTYGSTISHRLFTSLP